ncbi:hypothetical protein B0A49_06354 [Cryomyces minteri]|uniref:DUF7892 domain-containing protein n=1 Tax=Cryomyces minteri TaxID=331657 RepID=A0A4U0X945_9PEZI|nr:hypothetical protein B0A49_06354 [Cryomyces minteri]
MTKRELESDGFDEPVETKRRKVEQLPDDTMTATALTTAGLPAEIWQYVFQWLPPTCLGQVLQEVSILMSSSSALLPSLPYAFVTQDIHVVHSSALQDAVNIPPRIQLTKYYYKGHLESIQREFEEAKTLGPAAVEEWLKGLEGVGKDRLHDALRFERWEAKVSASAASLQLLPPKPTTLIDSNNKQTPVDRSRPIPSSVSMSETQLTASHPLPQRPYPTTQYGQPSLPLITAQTTRPPRNLLEVNEAKAARRADIERRCQALDPPILPNMLKHMDSFQAAVQISTPLTDAAWEVLRPRLLAQCSAAEQIENEIIQQINNFKTQQEDRRQEDTTNKDVKALIDRDWEESQKPIHERLSTYADEIISNDWANGRRISKENCPAFAAEVLLYVRRRFYASIAHVDANADSFGREVRQDSTDGVHKQRLILENMKWIFDAKIRTVTESLRRELFLCNGSGCEGNSKFYGFEGIIQHYGAKHTAAFSKGNVVVHWQTAEWPEHPPFHPDPSHAMSGLSAVSASVSMPAHAACQPTYAASQYGGFSRGATVTPQSGPLGPQSFTPGSFGQPQYGRNGNGPFAHPQPVSPDFQAQGPGYYGTQPMYSHSYANAFPYQNPVRSNFQDTYQPFNMYSGHPVQQPPPHGRPYVDQASAYAGYPQPFSMPHAQNSYPYQQSQQSSVLESGPTNYSYSQTGPGRSNLYQEQLNELAETARDIWNRTAGIKDLLQSVRIFVIIHHVGSRFRARFSNEPALDLFTDALATHDLMRPIKNTNGLACKICLSSSDPGTTYRSYSSRTVARKLYNVSSLIVHFKTVHVESARPSVIAETGVLSPRVDWKQDMIELPEHGVIADLIHAPGMDDHKLRVIAEVFSNCFPYPLPRIGLVTETASRPMRDDNGYASSFSLGSLASVPCPHSRSAEMSPNTHRSQSDKKKPKSGQDLQVLRSLEGQSLMDRSSQSTPEPGEDEYDPRRPAFIEPSGDRYTKPTHREKTRPISSTIHDRSYQSSGRSTVKPEDNVGALRPGLSDLCATGDHPQSLFVRHDIGPLHNLAGSQYSDNAHNGHQPDSARDRYEDRYVTNCYGNDPDDRLGVEFLPDYEARLPSPPKSARHVEQLLHENTKHDRIPHDALDLRDRSPSVPRGEAAAEQFLNEVLPGDRFEDYIRKAAEQDRRKEEELRAKWLVEQDNVNGPRDAPEAQADHPPYAERAPGPTGGYHAMQTPAVPLHHDLIHRRVSDLMYAPHQGDSTYRDNGFYRSNGDHSAHSAARRLPQRTEFPEPTSRMARTRSSRYQRYDEQWRQLSRARSKSPRRLEAHEDPPIYRDRSPDQRVTRTTSQQAPRDFASLDVDDYYSPEPLQSRYVDAPPIYVDEYGRQVEYVRIVSAPREMYPQRRYVVSQSDEPEGVVEYVRYAPRPHDEQFYDDQRAAYYEEDRPAYQAEAAPRIYEDDPMREVRYTEQP